MQVGWGAIINQAGWTSTMLRCNMDDLAMQLRCSLHQIRLKHGREMRSLEVALILPYFQREPGLLARALKSVVNQEPTLDWKVRAIIVDDESPLSPEEDLKEIAVPSWLTIDVVRRKNGGPGSARNSGLDAAGNADFVAFLDTDDVWASDHLFTAIQILEEEGGDFYFSDSQTTELETVFQFTGFPWPDVIGRVLENRHNDVFAIEADSAVSVLSRNYVCHTSSIVFRNTPRLAKK